MSLTLEDFSKAMSIPDKAPLTRVMLVLPLKVISEANALTRRGAPGHWRERLKRKHAQQREVMVELSNAMMGRKFELPVLVTLTRLGHKRIDPGNLEVSFKAVQDQVAASLGVDDGDEDKIDWKYRQEPIGVRQYSIRIEIQSILATL